MIGAARRPSAPDRGRRILAVLLGVCLLSIVLLATRWVSGGDVVVLQLSTDAAVFEQRLCAWQEHRQAPCGADTAAAVDAKPAVEDYGRLRMQLFVDSVGLVPGLVGLLLLFSLGLSRGAGLVNPIARHTLCGPAVAAGLFDIAENGMTGRALEDYQRIVLSDATVLDVHHASLIKWGLYALALLCLAGLAWGTARRGLVARRRWLASASVVSGMAGLLLAAGTFGASALLLKGGALFLVVALSLLAIWRWRCGPVPD